MCLSFWGRKSFLQARGEAQLKAGSFKGGNGVASTARLVSQAGRWHHLTLYEVSDTGKNSLRSKILSLKDGVKVQSVTTGKSLGIHSCGAALTAFSLWLFGRVVSRFELRKGCEPFQTSGADTG